MHPLEREQLERDREEAHRRATQTAPANADPPSALMPGFRIKPRGVGCLLITWALATFAVALVAVHYAHRWGIQ
jgi:hypothetical protein